MPLRMAMHIRERILFNLSPNFNDSLCYCYRNSMYVVHHCYKHRRELNASFYDWTEESTNVDADLVHPDKVLIALGTEKKFCCTECTLLVLQIVTFEALYVRNLVLGLKSCVLASLQDYCHRRRDTM